ncbi:hypothetical protein K1719_002429 [Acacia pycnantha]|nr:hypothetical protein K1719_002429 [Acacia pycnantha]
MAGGGDKSSPPSSHSFKKQFEDFLLQLEESGGLRDRIRTVVSEIESITRLMRASLLLVHQSRPTPERILQLANLYPRTSADQVKSLLFSELLRASQSGKKGVNKLEREGGEKKRMESEAVGNEGREFTGGEGVVEEQWKE